MAPMWILEKTRDMTPKEIVFSAVSALLLTKSSPTSLTILENGAGEDHTILCSFFEHETSSKSLCGFRRKEGGVGIVKTEQKDGTCTSQLDGPSHVSVILHFGRDVYATLESRTYMRPNKISKHEHQADSPGFWVKDWKHRRLTGVLR
jgi:hypothetical protein